MKNLFFTIVLWLTYAVADAQVSIVGKVTDASTGEPISSVYISASRSQAITNERGIFRMTIRPADTITVSHVGYQTMDVQPIVTHDTVAITLIREVIRLKEITILDYATEEELKTKIIETPVVESEQTKNARENMQKIRTLYALGFRVEKNDDEMFREYLKGPQSVNFKGLFTVIKNLTDPPSSRIMNFRNQGTSRPAGLYFIPKHRNVDYALASDSIPVDTVHQILTDTVHYFQKHRN